VLLAVDARNESIAVGLRAGGRWSARFRVSAADRSADEFAFLFAALLRERGADPAQVRAAVLSCVVPALAPRLAAALRELSGREALAVGPGVKTGLRIRTDNPGEVGSDLVCSAVAAVARLGAPCVVVDYGSALTFTAVAPPADLVGVAIAPGMEAAVEALRSRGAQLPQVRLEPVERAAGRNTADSIRSGVVRGWAGLTDRLVSDLSAELGGQATRVFLAGTGDPLVSGTAPSRGFDLWEPYLALEGLVLIAERNDLLGAGGEQK
jgi:type III pantothenate kinase